MAITFVGEAEGGNTTSGAFVVNVSAIAGLADGDFVVASLGKFDDDGTFTAPSGWTIVDEQLSTTGDDQRNCYAYKYLTSVAAEGATWSFGSGIADPKGAVILAFRGVDSTTPIEATVTGTLGSSNPTPTAPAITTLTNNAVVVVMMTLVQAAAVVGYVGGAPSGYTLGGDFTVNNGTAEFFTAMAYKTVATAGVETPGAFTTTGGGTPEFSARTIALKPAAGGTTHALEGDIALDVALDGIIFRETALAGDIALDIVLDGVIGRTTALVGDIDLPILLDGDVSLVGGAKFLAGDISLDITLDGVIGRTTKLVGDIDLPVTLDGVIVRTTKLVGDIAVPIDLDGNLSGLATVVPASLTITDAGTVTLTLADTTVATADASDGSTVTLTVADREP